LSWCDTWYMWMQHQNVPVLRPSKSQCGGWRTMQEKC
jgi:hypothetical protein